MKKKLGESHRRYWTQIKTGGLINIQKSGRKLRRHFKKSSNISKDIKGVIAYRLVSRQTDKNRKHAGWEMKQIRFDSKCQQNVERLDIYMDNDGNP